MLAQVRTESAATVAPKKVVKLRPVFAVFCNDTLESAVCLLTEIEIGAWNIGVDQTARLIDLQTTLEADYALIDGGVRDDDVIRGRATATLRAISAMFRRAAAAGLVDHGLLDPCAVSNPDLWEDLGRN